MKRKRKIVKIRKFVINYSLVLFVYLMIAVLYVAAGFQLTLETSTMFVVTIIVTLTFRTILFLVKEARIWTRKMANKLIKRIDIFFAKNKQ